MHELIAASQNRFDVVATETFDGTPIALGRDDRLRVGAAIDEAFGERLIERHVDRDVRFGVDARAGQPSSDNVTPSTSCERPVRLASATARSYCTVGAALRRLDRCSICAIARAARAWCLR